MLSSEGAPDNDERKGATASEDPEALRGSVPSIGILVITIGILVITIGILVITIGILVIGNDFSLNTP